MTIENKKNLRESDFDINAATNLLSRCHAEYIKQVQAVKYDQKTVDEINAKLKAGEKLDDEDLKAVQEMIRFKPPELPALPNWENKKIFEALGIEIQESSLN